MAAFAQHKIDADDDDRMDVVSESEKEKHKPEVSSKETENYLHCQRVSCCSTPSSFAVAVYLLI